MGPHYLILFAAMTAQSVAPPSAPPRPVQEVRDSDASAYAVGWNAAASRQYPIAVRAADAILQRRPWDRGALELKIYAAAGMNALQGLLTYEQWVARGHGEDAALLEPVAIAVLRDIAQGPRNELHVDALRALVAAKASGAREALDQEAKKKSDAQTVADLDAAKSGDQAAVKRLTDQAASAAASASLAQALAGLGVSAGEPGLLLMAQGRDPQARAAAAEALGNIASEASRATLASLQRDADPAARIAATVSLAQLGDTAALATVDRMLASNAPDTQIAATRAFGGRPGPWVEIIRPLLENPDGLTRIDAARAIAPVDPEAARRTLTSALGNANPVVRYESAHAIERTPGLRLTGEDVSALRARLRDTDPATRLAAAAALLRAARENG